MSTQLAMHLAVPSRKIPPSGLFTYRLVPQIAMYSDLCRTRPRYLVQKRFDSRRAALGIVDVGEDDVGVTGMRRP